MGDSYDSTEVAWNEKRTVKVPNGLIRVSTSGRVVRVDGVLKTDLIVRSILDVLGADQSTEGRLFNKRD